MAPKSRCGAVQEDLRQVFSAEITGDVTGALNSAMSELDEDGDRGVSLNELLRVGLAGVSSRSSGTNLLSQVCDSSYYTYDASD